MRDLQLPGQPYPLKVLVSQFPAKDQRPPLRFMIGIDTETFHETQHHLLIALDQPGDCRRAAGVGAGLLGRADRSQAADQTVP